MNKSIAGGARSLVLAFLAAAAGAAAARDLTAFDLMKEGNRYVGEQAKDKVVRVRSEKSIGGLTPTIWFVEYYDSTARMKCSEVKFGAGKMLDVKRPMRLLAPISGPDVPLDRDKLKIDSDKALKIVLKEPLLERVKVKATALKLERTKADGIVWNIRLWAAKTKQPEEDASIGEILLSATDGKLVKTDLNINRVN